MTRKSLLAMAAALGVWGSAQGGEPAANLLAAYRLALKNDATYLAAGAARDYTREELPKARAGLLPSLNVSGSRSDNTTTNVSADLLGRPQTRRSDYAYESYNASFRQPLFRAQSWAQYWQAGAQVDGAEATYVKDTHEVILRVAQAYFDAILAADQLQLAQGQRTSYEASLKQAEESLRLGTGTLTDVFDVKSRRDRALAQEIEADNAVEYTRRTLQMLTGVPTGALARLDAGRLDLQPPRPAALEEWFALAEANNPQIKAARSNVEVAENELLKQRAGHLPTVDLVASRQRGANETNTTIGTEYWTSSVGVQVSIPLLAGGYVLAASGQARAGLERARQQLEAASRGVLLAVRKEYNNMLQGVSYVRAQEQAVLSAEEAAKGNRKGIQAGTRMVIDLLNAERDLLAARAELSRSRHDYVLSLLRLKAMAGILQESDIEGVNRWLAPAATGGGA